MIASKFGIGQQVRHNMLNFLGVIVDVDPEYSLTDTSLVGDEKLRMHPWYHVVIEDDKGQAVHTYLAEIHLSGEVQDEHPEQPSLDALAASIRQQLQSPSLRN